MPWFLANRQVTESHAIGYERYAGIAFLKQEHVNFNNLYFSE